VVAGSCGIAEVSAGLKPLILLAVFGTRPTHWVGAPVVPCYKADLRSLLPGP